MGSYDSGAVIPERLSSQSNPKGRVRGVKVPIPTHTFSSADRAPVYGTGWREFESLKVYF